MKHISCIHWLGFMGSRMAEEMKWRPKLMCELPPTGVFVSRENFFLYRTRKPEIKSEGKNQQLKYVFSKAKKQRYPFNSESNFDSLFLLFKFIQVSNDLMCAAVNLSQHCTVVAGLVFLLFSRPKSLSQSCRHCQCTHGLWLVGPPWTLPLEL